MERIEEGQDNERNGCGTNFVTHLQVNIKYFISIVLAFPKDKPERELFLVSFGVC